MVIRNGLRDEAEKKLRGMLEKIYLVGRSKMPPEKERKSRWKNGKEGFRERKRGRLRRPNKKPQDGAGKMIPGRQKNASEGKQERVQKG